MKTVQITHSKVGNENDKINTIYIECGDAERLFTGVAADAAASAIAVINDGGGIQLDLDEGSKVEWPFLKNR